MTDLPTDLPTNLPVISVDASRISLDWAPVGEGELVKSHYVYFSLFAAPPRWVLSSYRAKDGYRSNGAQLYLRPRSVAAWSAVIQLLIAKWRRQLGRRLHFTH